MELMDRLQGVSDDVEILMNERCLCIGDVVISKDEHGKCAILDAMKAPNMLQDNLISLYIQKDDSQIMTIIFLFLFSIISKNSS